MAEKHRLDIPGAWHHVMNRGHNRQDIFPEDDDCESFASLLNQVTGPGGIEIHAFAFMSNHWHLLVHTPTAGLPAAMQYVEGVYAQRFNKKYGRDGALCKGRYRSIHIDTEAHLVEIPRYIDNNPVAAKIVADPGNYRWSSHRPLAHDEPAPDFLATNIILPTYFNNDPTAYRQFVLRQDSQLAVEYALSVEATNRSGALTDALREHHAASRSLTSQGPIAEVEKFVASALAVPRQSLYRRGRAHDQQPGALALTLLYRLKIATPSELADLYGFASRSGVTSAIHRFEANAAGDQRMSRILDEGLQLLPRLAA